MSKPKKLIQSGKQGSRSNESGQQAGSDEERILEPFELTQLVVELDRTVGSWRNRCHLWVTPSGYGLHGHPPGLINYSVDEDVESCRWATMEVESVVAEMAERLRLPNAWPAQLSRLFQWEVIESWDPAILGLEFKDNANLRGKAIVVQLKQPAEVLAFQLDFSKYGTGLPITVGQVARAAGLMSVESIRAEPGLEPSTACLTDDDWEELAAALEDGGTR
jgi:hypothetical protein